MATGGSPIRRANAKVYRIGYKDGQQGAELRFTRQQRKAAIQKGIEIAGAKYKAQLEAMRAEYEAKFDAGMKLVFEEGRAQGYKEGVQATQEALPASESRPHQKTRRATSTHQAAPSNAPKMPHSTAPARIEVLNLPAELFDRLKAIPINWVDQLLGMTDFSLWKHGFSSDDVIMIDKVIGDCPNLYRTRLKK